MNNKNIFLLVLGMSLSMTALATSPATAPAVRNFCVWDPVGANGPVVSLMKEVVSKSVGWGAPLKIHAYTDEKVQVADFQGGVCDAAMMTDISARQFNSFTSTMGAVGAIPGETEFRSLMTTLASEKAAPLMRERQYEVAGLVPIGKVFMFVRDRTIDRPEMFQGRKMAVMNDDPAGVSMVRRVGGSVVSATLSSFAGQFNNGSVDITFAPAVAYNTMELYKGLGDTGGILDYPLLHTSLQVVIYYDRFPPNYGQTMRDYTLSRLDEMLARAKSAEAEIPEKYWISVAGAQRDEYENFMRAARIDLRNQGLYNAKSLTLMRKVRCQQQPSNAECVDKLE